MGSTYRYKIVCIHGGSVMKEVPDHFATARLTPQRHADQVTRHVSHHYGTREACCVRPVPDFVFAHCRVK